MTTHAVLSPSSAARWMRCPGSVALSKGLPDNSSRDANEGTAAHELAAMCLTNNLDAVAYLGRLIGGFTVDIDMASAVQVYVDFVRRITGDRYVEQRLSISHITAEKDAAGTSDAVVLDTDNDTLWVVDLKFGRGVKVFAENNEQLQIYALAALEEYGFLFEPAKVCVAIVQPRIDHIDVWELTTDELRGFGVLASDAARATSEADAPLVPGTKQCKFCRAKATCPALRQQVVEQFECLQPPADGDSGQLATAMSKVDLIEDWCRAVRAETERRLFAGEAVSGWKLVAGRRGSRKWSDETGAIEVMKSMRMRQDQMFDFKVISPTTAEKLAKAGEIGERQWPRLQSLITQDEGRPSVAPESDKRQALTVGADAFEVLA